jgi:serine/threonine protein phosphatase PrpC
VAAGFAAQGLRDTMEDCFCIDAGLSEEGEPSLIASHGAGYAAVFDGHGDRGRHVASHCERALQSILFDELRRVATTSSSTSSSASLPSEGGGGGGGGGGGAKRLTGSHDWVAALHRTPVAEVVRAFVRAFEACHEALPATDANAMSGSTALCALVLPVIVDGSPARSQVSARGWRRSTMTVWIANCGDTRAVVGRSSGVADPPQQHATRPSIDRIGTTSALLLDIQLSHDHDAGRQDEADRIRAAGGSVFRHRGGIPRVMGMLAVTRSIGDRYLNPFVIPTPHVVKYEVHTDDQFLILATDGVWGFVSNQEAVAVVSQALARVRYTTTLSRYQALHCAARVLVRFTLDRCHGNDNVAAVIIDLHAAHRGGPARPRPI